MIFKELVDKYNEEEILSLFIKEYPEEEKNLDGYKCVLNKLKTLNPIETDFIISIDEVTDETHWNNGEVDIETWKDVYGEKEGVHYAIEFEPWERWLGSKVNLSKFDEKEILIHCLFEMTYLGYDVEQIEEKRQSLIQAVDEVNQGDFKYKTFEEVKKELNIPNENDLKIVSYKRTVK